MSESGGNKSSLGFDSLLYPLAPVPVTYPQLEGTSAAAFADILQQQQQQQQTNLMNMNPNITSKMAGGYAAANRQGYGGATNDPSSIHNMMPSMTTHNYRQMPIGGGGDGGGTTHSSATPSLTIEQQIMMMAAAPRNNNLQQAHPNDAIINSSIIDLAIIDLALRGASHSTTTSASAAGCYNPYQIPSTMMNQQQTHGHQFANQNYLDDYTLKRHNDKVTVAATAALAAQAQHSAVYRPAIATLNTAATHDMPTFRDSDNNILYAAARLAHMPFNARSITISSSSTNDNNNNNNENETASPDHPLKLVLPSDCKILDSVHIFLRRHCIELYVTTEEDMMPGIGMFNCLSCFTIMIMAYSYLLI